MRFLFLGIDEGFKRSGPGCADTIILISVSALKGNLVMLSIPRDLWLPVSRRFYSRIGVVYTTVEANQPGEGAMALTSLVSKEFQVPVHYHVSVKMQGFINIVDALGGVDIVLSRPRVRFPAGPVHFDGPAALAYARDRADIDDFDRMLQAQVLIKGILAKAVKVRTWTKLPLVFRALKTVVETNIPVWEWPRIAIMIILSYRRNVEGYGITRDMVHPVITSMGEQVMQPNWDSTKALVKMIFKK